LDVSLHVSVKVKEQTQEEQQFVNFGGISDIVFDKNGSIFSYKVNPATAYDGGIVDMILFPAIRS